MSASETSGMRDSLRAYFSAIRHLEQARSYWTRREDEAGRIPAAEKAVQDAFDAAVLDSSARTQASDGE
jgi:hypothetical protein